jgi:general secretion pathway protein A
MYEKFFGLRELPFQLAPNPRFLLLSTSHSEALSNLEYGITARKGMTVLLGEAGTGKTTIIRTAMQKWASAGHLVSYINNPTLTRDEFVESLASTFDLGAEAAASKPRMLLALTDLVMRRYAQGLVTGLLIDEAQSLSDELLEEIRLLANVETADEKVFPVVLAGQPELADRLNTVGLRQLKQRIALRCALLPLDLKETAAYIAGRIRLAGGVAGQVFTREAVIAIHEHSRGIPRVINVIADNTLLTAFAANTRRVTRQMVDDVSRDFDLSAETQAEPAAPPLRVVPPVSPAARASNSASASMFEGTTAQPPAAADRPEPEDGIFAAASPRRRFGFFG